MYGRVGKDVRERHSKGIGGVVVPVHRKDRDIILVIPEDEYSYILINAFTVNKMFSGKSTEHFVNMVNWFGHSV